MLKTQKMENFYSSYLPVRRGILRVALGRKWRAKREVSTMLRLV